MKNRNSVAVASRSFSRHPVLREEISKIYRNVTFNESGKSLAGQELIDFFRGHEKIITALEKLDRKFFESLSGLKVVSKYGVGLDMIDLEAMEEYGIRIGWTGGVNRRSVSEMVISAAIALLHRVPQANLEVRSGGWRQLMGNQLTGKTIGIIGCGHIGKDLAILLKAFQCSVLAYDIEDFPEFYREHDIIPLGIEELLSISDIVTLHLPLDESTFNILNRNRLNLIKPGAFLINMARGGLFKEEAVKEMLMDGRLSGAAIDVFSEEPPADMELLNLPNVLATPHIGGSTEESVLAMGRAAISGLESAVLPSMLDPYLKCI